MEGDLTQIKANDYSGLDKYLSVSKENYNENKNRQISIFESNFDNYRKPTNFSVNTRKIQSDNELDFGHKVKFTIPRYGDKLSDIYLEVKLPTLTNVGYVNTVGYALIEYINIEIGGHIIEEHTSEWLDIRSKLMTGKDYRDGVNEMVKHYISYTDSSFQGGNVIIPLNFWFCGSYSQSFPIVALTHQDIIINIKFRNFNQLWLSYEDEVPSETPKIISGHLLVDYIRLNELERNYIYKKKTHKYLIKQLQVLDMGVNNNVDKIKVNLESINYPVIELIWVIRRESRPEEKDWFNYTDDPTGTTVDDDPILTAKITFSEKERLEEHSSHFFRMIQPHKFHSNIPDDYIYMYSFATKPENDSQPSGCCNFSTIDDIYLHLGLKTGLADSKIYVYAINYNVLVVEDGYAWLEKCLST